MKQPKLRFKADDGTKFPDWEKNNFSDVFDSINNSTFSRDCLNYVDGNVKYIHYGDILTTFDSTVNVEASDVPYVNKDIDCQKYQLLADGDIIVADTAEDDTVGKAVEIVNASNVKVISGLHTIACRPKLKFTSGYLGYYMNSNSYHNQLHPYMQGIKVTSISKANIALTNISIPSLPEQQKIASLFSEIDTLIQSAEKELEGYRELKQGMLQKMFPKKGETTPEIRFPEFTGDWEKQKCKDFANESSEKGNSGANARKLTVKLHNKGVEEASEKTQGSDNTQYYIRRAGQFVYGKQNFFNGALGIVPDKLDGFESTKDVPAFDIDESVDTKWFYYYIARPEIYEPQEALCTGTGSKRFHVDEFYNLSIFVPQISEQIKIRTFFENLDNLIASQQQELDDYKEIKKGLLQQMFC